MTFALRPYQDDFVHKVRLEYRNGTQSVILVAATGAGKTVVFSYIAKSAAEKGKRILILAHRDTLIKQASEKLGEYGVKHGIIMAGFTPALYQLVQVASVQTLVRRLDKIRQNFDMIIIDEAHLSAAKSYQTVVAKWPNAKLLGVTGSPIRLDGKGLGRPYGGLYDEMVQGISIRELISQGFLVKPTVYASKTRIITEGIKTVAGDYESKALAEVMDKPVITGSAIAEWRRVCPGVPGVAWCVNVAHAQHVAEEFNQAGIPAIALSGNDDPAERSKALKALANGSVKIVTFAMLLVEGVDCPAIGCVILLRPTMSLASYLQVIGRGLRPVYAPGMPIGTVEQRKAAISAGTKGPKCFVLDHADLWSRHGFADEEREWSLEGNKKKKGKKKDPADEALKLRQCPKCFLVTDPEPVCPGCGHVFEAAERKIEQVDGELTEITAEMQERMKAQQRSAQAAAKSVEDMMAQLGYSRGRAEAIVKAREEKAAVRTQLIFDLNEWRAKTGQSSLQLFDVAISDLKSFKPKALKLLREQFDEHRRQYFKARPGDDLGLAQSLQGILYPNSQPGSDAAF